MKCRCKVFVSVVLLILVLCTIAAPNPAYAVTAGRDVTDETVAAYNEEELEEAYINIINFAEDNGIEIGMTFADFLGNYEGQEVDEFEQMFYSTLSVNTASVTSASSGGGKYYHNTGLDCPEEANYSKYNLLDVVKKGDIVFEAQGGFGLTGHVALVLGVFSDADGREYIRVIEALPGYGVVRGILDDTRADEQEVTILRVEGATTVICNRVINFCINQLGDSYYLDLAKDTSSSETDWYCSELVWAAYYNEGIDIEVANSAEAGVTPRDIIQSILTTKVEYQEG